MLLVLADRVIMCVEPGEQRSQMLDEAGVRIDIEIEISVLIEY